MKRPASLRRTSTFFGLLAAFAPLALQACGGSSSSKAPTVSGFALQFAHAACDNLGACCNASGIAYDENGCLTAVEGEAQAEIINPATAAGATYNPTAADACINALAGEVKDCTTGISAREGASYAQSCSAVFSGTKAPGETCTTSYECSAGSVSGAFGFCGEIDSVQKACQIQNPGAIGAACAAEGPGSPATISNCATAGLTCSAAGTCQPKVSVGAACTVSDNCVAGTYCTGSICAADLAAGAACVPYQDTCVSGFMCGGTSSTCVAVQATGTACTSDSQCEVACNDGKCAASAFASAQICGG